ncbi:hypothetical protein FB45DRAFT_1001503 [Roridomyces roridus]|uniref:Uncharacterized protein n=1 Tax=Roridomyces roridus TaxID=1738132 RepID=A0AAD7FS57_9AGAR|nr:hypothetical protein FB45DRAFT_1001503 [Roridomyces roridus]
MQLNVALVTGAILIAASPVLGASFVWFAGADCTGTVIADVPDFPTGDCFGLPNRATAKSISFSGVPSVVEFFQSGGGHDQCTNGPFATFGGGSGCANGPNGFNIESFIYD